MTPIDAILRQLDDAWGHPYESVASVLDGVTDDECTWQPPGYDDVEREDAGPAPGTIAWHVAHITACKNEYACYVRDRGKDVDLEGAEHEIPPTWKAARKALDAAHAWLRHEVEAVKPDELTLAANHKMPLDEFLAMAIRHDTWHAGQIAVLKRLYAQRGQATLP